MADAFLEVSDLSIWFPAVYGEMPIVRNVSFDVASGECLGLVGESGSGKSLLSLSMIGLLPSSALVAGSIRLLGEELLGRSERFLRRLRGDQITMVYQDAMTSLNPGLTIRRQLEQAVQRDGDRTAAELIEAVQIRDVSRCLASFPHQLSGGQRQRALIALALARRPSLVIADEPTTSLDVTVQAAIMKLLTDLKAEFGFALVFVSHDLGLVATIADRLAVVYAGQIAEVGVTAEVLGHPRHPYTEGLLRSSRSLEEGWDELAQIPGMVPTPGEFSDGCRFAPRCDFRQAICDSEVPTATTSGERTVLCHFPLSKVDRDV